MIFPVCLVKNGHTFQIKLFHIPFLFDEEWACRCPFTILHAKERKTIARRLWFYDLNLLTHFAYNKQQIRYKKNVEWLPMRRISTIDQNEFMLPSRDLCTAFNNEQTDILE